MKNKLGFTMVELLGVITIMGILATIAIPAVSNYLAQSRAKSFDVIVKSTYEACENYMMREGTMLSTGETLTINVKKIVDENLLEDIKDPAGGQSCSSASNVVVKGLGMNKGISAYEYKVTIVCPSKTITKTFPE